MNNVKQLKKYCDGMNVNPQLLSTTLYGFSKIRAP